MTGNYGEDREMKSLLFKTHSDSYIFLGGSGFIWGRILVPYLNLHFQKAFICSPQDCERCVCPLSKLSDPKGLCPFEGH